MPASESVGSEIEELAREDLLLACDRAREIVAEHPADEAAAILLTTLVSKAAAEHRDDRVAADLVDAAPDVLEASRLFEAGEDEAAEVLLRNHLASHCDDLPAMRLMAQIAAKCGFVGNAERIAARALQVDPSSIPMRLTLASILFYKGSEEEGANASDRALALVDEAIEIEPANKAALSLKATFLAHLRDPENAAAAFDAALRADSFNPGIWIAAGIVRRTLGRVGPAVAAFRTALAIQPSNSRAWWELANLKTFRFLPSDAPLIEEALASGGSNGDAERAELHFALFKAYDDHGNRQRAAEHLHRGNALKRGLNPYDAGQVTREVDRAIATYTEQFFAARRDYGCESDELIFVVGMYRAGSTLVEQILSSHSQVEGTEELPYVLDMAKEIENAVPGQTVEAFLSSAAPAQIEGLAGKLLELSRRHKRTGRPYFIDKSPSNWRYIGLIHTLLPNARIVDVRRNPLDCCFANYAQNYGGGVTFSYDQTDMARFYADYVRLMRHSAKLLGDRYHRVIYEDLVDAPEPEIRRLIAFLGLDFEESCLRFFETERAVYTPSSQQVRQPINRSGLDRWRPYAEWLQPMIKFLGDLPATYRN